MQIKSNVIVVGFVKSFSSLSAPANWYVDKDIACLEGEITASTENDGLSTVVQDHRVPQR